MVHSCTFCSYHSNTRLNVIKHSFASHSMEPTFHIACGMKGCLHPFKFGSIFSFKTYASQKHPNWQESVNDEAATVTIIPPPPSLTPSLDSTKDHLATTSQIPDPVELTESQTVNEHLAGNSGSLTNHFTPQFCPPAQRTAALFLLTFQERYKLSQTAINFGVGSINVIVNGVCESVHGSIQSSLDSDRCSSTDVAACFDDDDDEDPFASLHTEYKQSKYYREEFGLIASCELGSWG